MIKKSILIFVLLIVGSCSNTPTGKKEVPNGYLSTIGEGEDQIMVAVVNGTPLRDGEGFGGIIKRRDSSYLNSVFDFRADHDPDRFNNENLDAAWTAVSPYIHTRFEDELKGLAEGSGLSFEMLRRAHMIPVLGDYACSGVIVWGDA